MLMFRVAGGDGRNIALPYSAHPHAFPASGIVLALALVFILASLGKARSQPQDAQSGIRFDIPVQSLASALDAYSAAAGKEVFYDGVAGTGQRSSPVSGEFTPENALRILLEGTGLVIMPSGPGAYTLIHAPDRAASEVASARMAVDGQYTRYFAIIQANIGSTLCRTRRTWPVSSPLVIRFRICASGAIQQAELSAPTGGEVRDANLSEALLALTLDEPPPRAMPQPITMVVFPRKDVRTTVCGDIDANRTSH